VVLVVASSMSIYRVWVQAGSKCSSGIGAKGLLMLAGLFALSGCSQEFDPWHEDPTTGRWYTQQQVERGAQVYQRHCAVCHGAKAEATPAWIKPDAEGFYPPPPLNGSGHAWHHPFEQLKSTINQGTSGRMPAWKDQLDDQQVEAVIAWFQSLWPDQGYQIWQRRHPH
jgi:mono/diheme cytochrome c family protein